MKLLLLALVALASAEPDSDSLWYSRFGYSGLNYPTTGYTAGYSGYNGFYPTNTYTAGYQPYSNNVFHSLGKREAEAEPNHHLFYNQHPFYNQQVYKTPLTTVGEPVFKSGTFHTNLRNVAKGVHTPYAAHTVGQVYQPVYNHFVKREADSEPEAEAFHHTVAHPYAATYGLNYQYPSAYNYNRFYSGYTGFPRTVYNHGLYKREAESDSESYYPYSGYNNFYSGYRTPYVNNFAYNAAYTTPYNRYYNGYNY